MKRPLIVLVMVMAGVSLFAQTRTRTKVTLEVEESSVISTTSHKVVLVVQNHAARGAEIPFMALTDALTAKLSGRGFQVINPYNSYGENLNRTSRGETLPETSAMAVALPAVGRAVGDVAMADHAVVAKLVHRP